MDLITDVILVIFYGLILLFLRDFKKSTDRRLASLENRISGPAEVTDEWKKKLIDALDS